MLKEFVFWGIFSLVLAGIAGTLIRDHVRRKRREAEEARLRAMSVQDKSVAVAALPLPFDPAATRVHVGAAPVGAPAAKSSNEGPILAPTAVPRLVCVGGSQKDNSFTITAAGITVGRGRNNDIVITDPRASKRHAWVGIVGRKVILRDFGSTNGTFLNARIDAPVSEVVLNPGDTISFGGHGRDQFRFVAD